MDQTSPGVDSIFAVALEKTSPEELASYLDQACGEDAELRQRMERLLGAHPKAGSFLESPPSGLSETEHHPVAEGPGTVIGPYKLREQIGEGGMGVVFVAEQSRPVRRKVALKIIKPGMDTREVIARFEAERQALALMDHPNIAKVLDAGSTESGRPYFVMELVRGTPIAEYCDQKELSVSERLELFLQVCHAIQHAHQKAIIHRDIKPSNVIVSVHDDKPVPVVIDFGVAKAIDRELTERTIYTQFRQVLGTPMYMSPEQAGQSDLDVDTRSDVYSLGVLLYELLTGTTPFDRDRFENAFFEEIRRIIRDEEPPKPSTRISGLGTTAPTISACRRTDPERLRQLMRGDLDWIVMRALEKDRTRRYETANAFARDVERYLKDEPVEAGPPSAWYRCRKYVRRNRGPVTAATAIGITLLAGLVGTLLMLRHARNETARVRQVEAELRATLESLHEELIDRGLEKAFQGDREVAERTIEKAKQAGVSEGWIHLLRGVVNFYDGRTREAIKDWETTRRLEPDNPSALAMLAVAYAWDQDIERFAARMSDLKGVSPREEYEPYDRMFLAFANVYRDPQAALGDLERLVQERPTWNIARTWLVASLAHTALDTGRVEFADRAIEELSVLRTQLPDTPAIMMADLWAHCVAIHIKEELGEPTDDLRSQAKLAAKKLGRVERFSAARLSRAMYFTLCGESELALEECRKAAKDGSHQNSLAAFAFGLDKMDAAIDVLRDPDTVRRSYTGMILAQLQTEDPSAHGELANQCLIALRADPDTSTRIKALNVLLLLGKSAEVNRAIQDDAGLSDPSYMTHVIPANLVKDTDAAYEWLLEKAGDSRVAQHKAQYLAALAYLAQGNRTAAREHFEACVACGQINWANHYWAEFYAERLRSEPTWPPWIPIAEAQATDARREAP